MSQHAEPDSTLPYRFCLLGYLKWSWNGLVGSGFICELLHTGWLDYQLNVYMSTSNANNDNDSRIHTIAMTQMSQNFT